MIDIDFTDTDNKVSVRIDNEVQELPIKQIKKLPTYIELNQSLNTALSNNIILDAGICYSHEEEISDSTEIEITKSNLLDIDGVVTVTIYDENNEYYLKNTLFKKGHITDSIKNTLPLGNYTMLIEYAGNKYYEPSSLIIGFNIEKRLGECTLEKEQYFGNFSENISIRGILKDKERNTPISQCILYYDFDTETYNTKTNNDGEFILNITIPEPDIEHCTLASYIDNYEEKIMQPVCENGEYVYDEDGNVIYEEVPKTNENVFYQTNNEELGYFNTSYIINVYTNNESYYLDTTQVEIIANKAPTNIVVQSINSNTTSNILDLNGHVISSYNNKDNKVKYGKVQIELPDFHYTYNNLIDIEDDTFNASINLAEVYNAYNVNEITDLIPYDTTNIATNIIVSGDIYSQTHEAVNKGETFTIEAQVKSNMSEEYVKDGSLIFELYENDVIIYRYATEIDSSGIGIFNFNTSKAANYDVQVKYMGIFGYENSTSDKYEVRIV